MSNKETEHKPPFAGFLKDWQGRKKEKAKKEVQESEEERNRKKKRRVFAVFIVTVILMILMLMLLKGCGDDSKALPENVPEYEEGQETGHGDGKAKVQHNRLNLAVMHDYEVTKKKQDFYFAYADQNYYEIEMSIRDADGELYRTKRIRPGTQVGIPGYVFLPKGENDLSAVIAAYDPKTHDLISEAVTMEFTVTKK